MSLTHVFPGKSAHSADRLVRLRVNEPSAQIKKNLKDRLIAVFGRGKRAEKVGSYVAEADRRGLARVPDGTSRSGAKSENLTGKTREESRRKAKHAEELPREHPAESPRHGLRRVAFSVLVSFQSSVCVLSEGRIDFQDGSGWPHAAAVAGLARASRAAWAAVSAARIVSGMPTPSKALPPRIIRGICPARRRIAATRVDVSKRILRHRPRMAGDFDEERFADGAEQFLNLGAGHRFEGFVVAVEQFGLRRAADEDATSTRFRRWRGSGISH